MYSTDSWWSWVAGVTCKWFAAGLDVTTAGSLYIVQIPKVQVYWSPEILSELEDCHLPIHVFIISHSGFKINWTDHKWILACATRCWLAKLKFPFCFLKLMYMMQNEHLLRTTIPLVMMHLICKRYILVLEVPESKISNIIPARKTLKAASVQIQEISLTSHILESILKCQTN